MTNPFTENPDEKTKLIVMPLTPAVLARAAEIGYVGINVRLADLNLDIMLVYDRDEGEVKENLKKLGLDPSQEMGQPPTKTYVN